MKSERRHELQHNELADWIVKIGENVKPYQNAILGGVAVVLAILAGYSWLSRSSASANAEAWTDFSAGISRPSMELLSKTYEERPGTTVASMAAVVSADLRLAAGCNKLFTDKATGQSEINKAIELYAVGKEADQPPMIRQQALFGLARAKEAKGELEPAKQYYSDLLKQWPEGTYASEAKRRTADLANNDTKRMFDEFRNFPKTPFEKPPGEPGKRPSSDLPDNPPNADEEPKATGEKDQPKSPAAPAKVDEKKPSEKAGEGKATDEKAVEKKADAAAAPAKAEPPKMEAKQ